MYKIELTAREYNTLCWLSDRGYDASLLDLASVNTDNEETPVLSIEEHNAWAIAEEVNNNPEAWLACCGDAYLRGKLNHFINSIV